MPNSLGLLTQAVENILQSALLFGGVIPDRAPILPLELVGVASYPACQLPGAQLTSIVEIPAVPPLSIPAYEPAALVKNLRRFLCEAEGLPPRSFLFLCSPRERARIGLGTDERSLGAEEADADRRREMVLANTLALGLRSGIDASLQEAVATLAEMLETARSLFTELERVSFPTAECPTDGTPLCSP